MDRSRLGILLSAVLVSGALFSLQFSGTYNISSDSLLKDIPEPVITGVSVFLVVAAWIVALILFAKLVYRSWKMVDSQLFRLWDVIVPESTIVRFGIVLIVFLFLFAFGPLVVIQWVGINDDSGDIERQVGLNESETSQENETERNATEGLASTHISGSSPAGVNQPTSATAGLPAPIT